MARMEITQKITNVLGGQIYQSGINLYKQAPDVASFSVLPLKQTLAYTWGLHYLMLLRHIIGVTEQVGQVRTGVVSTNDGRGRGLHSANYI